MKKHAWVKEPMTAVDYGQNWSDEPWKESEGRYRCDGCGLSVLIWDNETLDDLNDRGITADCDFETVKKVLND